MKVFKLPVLRRCGQACVGFALIPLPKNVNEAGTSLLSLHLRIQILFLHLEACSERVTQLSLSSRRM